MDSGGLLRDEDFAFAPEDVGFLEAVLCDRSCNAYGQTVEKFQGNFSTVSSAPTAFLASGVPGQLLTTGSSLASPSLAPTLFQIAGSRSSFNTSEQFSAPASAFLASELLAAPASRSFQDLSSRPPLCATSLTAAALSSRTAFSRHSQPQPQPIWGPRRLAPPPLHPTASAQPVRGPKQAVSAPERVMPWPWSNPQSSLAWSQPQHQQLQQQFSPSVPAFTSQASVTAERCMQATTLGSFGADIVLDEDLMAEIEAAPWPPFLTSLAGGYTGSLTLPPRPDAPSVCTAVATILGTTLPEVPAATAPAATAAAAAAAAPAMPPEPAPLAPQPVGLPSARSSANSSSSSVLQADGSCMRSGSSAAGMMDEMADVKANLQASGPAAAAAAEAASQQQQLWSTAPPHQHYLPVYVLPQLSLSQTQSQPQVQDLTAQRKRAPPLAQPELPSHIWTAQLSTPPVLPFSAASLQATVAALPAPLAPARVIGSSGAAQIAIAAAVAFPAQSPGLPAAAAYNNNSMTGLPAAALQQEAPAAMPWPPVAAAHEVRPAGAVPAGAVQDSVTSAAAPAASADGARRDHNSGSKVKVRRNAGGRDTSLFSAAAAAAAAMAAALSAASNLVKTETEGERTGPVASMEAVRAGGVPSAAAASDLQPPAGGDAGSAGALNRTRSGISLESLRAMFELPAQEVVRALGISATDLKRRCRALGIRRWPQRKLISLKRLAEAVEEDGDLSVEDRQSVLDQVADNRARIFDEPDTELDARLKSLRQVQYKRHFVERRTNGF